MAVNALMMDETLPRLSKGANGPSYNPLQTAPSYDEEEGINGGDFLDPPRQDPPAHIRGITDEGIFLS